MKKALSLLQKEQLIYPMGKLRGQMRYTITDDAIRKFIGNCLVIQSHIIDLMNRLWSYRIRKVDHYDRRWMQMIYGHREADKIISSNFAFLEDELPRFIAERLSGHQRLLSLDGSISNLDLISRSGSGSNIDNERKKTALKAEIEETRRRVEQEASALEQYIKKEIEDMQVVYANTFKEYRFPLERVMQLLALPLLDHGKRQFRR